MKIPNKINEIIQDMTYSIDSVGMSGSQVICLDEMVLKIEKQQENLEHERIIMDWLADKLPVPRVICNENEKGINYLLMSKIKGKMSCSAELLENPKHLVKLLADGLRMIWSVDTKECPYTNLIDDKFRQAEIRVRNDLCDMADVEPSTYGVNGFENPSKLLQWLKENRPDEEPYFSHGDYCLPNIIINDDKIEGFIDLGRSGIADKYQDIALCYRSLQHNFEGKYSGVAYEGFDATMFFNELNIVPDWEKINYYILLDELF